MTTETVAPERLDAPLIRLCIAVLVGAVPAILDTTIVNVALETLSREFHTTVTTIQWVSTAYLLALAVVIPLTGWAVDRFGAKRVWMAATVLFLTGSMLCGVAWSIGSLIAFRVLQGIGGGMLLPLAQTIVVQAAGPKRLGQVMGVIAVPAQLAPIIGPVIGGVIVDSISWRWIFYVNVPLCLAALALAIRFMEDDAERGVARLDVLGLALLSPGLAAVVYGFSESASHGGFGAAQVLVPLLAGVALLVAFTLHARRAAHPLIDLALFRARSFAASSALMFLFGLSLFGAMLLLPLYYQQARGQSALDAGLLLAPQGVGTMLAIVVVGKLTARTGPRAIALAGMALAVLGTLAYTQVTAHTSEWLLGASLLVRGAGLGAAMVSVMAAMFSDVPRTSVPRASSASRILQQVGGSLGTALLAVVLQHQLASGAEPAAAFATAFWWALGLTAFALVPALLLPARAPE